jgi:hypothetical protein
MKSEHTTTDQTSENATAPASEQWEIIGQIDIGFGHCVIGDAILATNESDLIQKSAAQLAHDGLMTAQVSSERYPLAVLCKTGFGDGCYRVEVRRDAATGVIAELRVKFL